MPIAKVITAQRDFSAGEADIWLKRSDDHPLLKAASRQLSNWRILNSRGLNNRPGRTAVGLEGPRVDVLYMTASSKFFLVFGNTYLRVYNAAFGKVFDSGNVMPWSSVTAAQVVWDVYQNSIYVCFPGMQPQILAWDGISQTSTWTLTPYAEELESSGQKRTVFYRLSPPGVTLLPSGQSSGVVQRLIITNPGLFTSVPSITIGAPGSGTRATAKAGITAQLVGISGGGGILGGNPVGATLYLPDGVSFYITSAELVTPPSGGNYYAINNGYLISGGSITGAGATAPSNPVAATSISGGFAISTSPTFSLNWVLDPANTNLIQGGSGYTANPAVSLSVGTAAVTASITAGIGVGTTAVLTFSAPMQLTNAYIGTRIRYANRQILITGVTSPTTAVGTIEEQLFPSGIYATAAGSTNLAAIFSLGDEIIGQTSGAKGVVASFNANSTQVTLQLLSATQFTIPEVVAGPNGSVTFGKAVSINQPPVAVTIWDDEVMNSLRGWPSSCFVDQGRLGLCNFPALPPLIVWSAQGTFNDLYTDANNATPINAIQELAPGKSQVLYVVPGAEGSEFVFCDNAVYYIPINQSNPLKPGSVAFNTLTTDGCAAVKPKQAQQSIIFIGASGKQIKAVNAIGAYYRPYIIDDIAELHSHLINNPVAIAVPGGSNQYEERYLYVLNSDGSIMVGKYAVKAGVIDAANVGWLPWTGAGSATWIAALNGHPEVVVTGSYAPNGIAAVSVVEQVDATQFVDAGMLYNGPPTALAAPAGLGPLWWLANGAVDLMDGGRMMGTYQVDGSGNLVPQNNAGENFASTTLTAGQAWTAMFEPFVPAVQPGEDVNQRLRKRRIQRFEVYVQNSTGFVFARLFAGPLTRTSPALGTIMQQRRITAWNQDDDPTQPPPLREQAYSMRPIGREHDPRVAIIKDTPGPLTILESDMEVSV